MFGRTPLRDLGGQPWAALSREERLFCAELFVAARAELPRFVRWLGAQPGMAGCPLDAALDWEIAYEVCFYRDLLFAAGQSVRQSRFSDKRTFDLCLFSPRDIVIIEAKAQGPFETKQNAEFARDKQDVLDNTLSFSLISPKPSTRKITTTHTLYLLASERIVR